MIQLDPIKILHDKIALFRRSLYLMGCIFIILGVGIIFIPQLIQYIFVIGFVLIGLTLLLLGVRVSHIADVVSRFELLGGKKIRD